MQIILTEQVEKLGTVGDIVKVKSGYARNFLLPQKLALRATKDNLELFEQKKSEFLKKSEEKKAAAKKVFDLVENKTLIIIRHASDEGKLYGSVMTRDICDELSQKFKNEFKKSSIILEKAIHEIGVYEAKVRVHADFLATINVVVARTEKEAKELQAKGKEKAAAEAAQAEAPKKAESTKEEAPKEAPKEEAEKPAEESAE